MRDTSSCQKSSALLIDQCLPVQPSDVRPPNKKAYPDSESSLVPSATLFLQPDNFVQHTTNPVSHTHTVLEVGNFPNNDPAKAFLESRSHFGAWCVVSSPLVLGLDITNDTKLDSVWDIISNK